MKSLIRTWIAALVLTMALAAGQGLAQTTQRIAFPHGADSTTLSGRIQGRQDVTYVLGARAGQQLQITMTSGNASAYFNVTAPGADSAMFIGSTTGTRMQATLPATGDYRVVVYLMRNAARRGEVANYNLTIRITGRPAGGTSEPEYFRVTGLIPGDTLNQRSGPAVTFPVVGRLPERTRVRNLGCRDTVQRWCQVESRGVRGWVAARFLR